jgi:hypothetical protein
VGFEARLTRDERVMLTLSRVSAAADEAGFVE